MLPRLECVGLEDNLEQCARRLTELHVAALPICERSGDVRGVLTNQGIVEALARGADPAKTTAGQIASAVNPVRGDETIEAALSIMKQHRIGTLPVVDGARLIGRVTQNDIARTLHVAQESGPQVMLASISDRDLMFADGGLATYLSTGASAMRCIRAALLAAGKQSVYRVLDFPSGYGRVLRLFKAEFPKAKLAACDIDADAVDFCAREFDATPFVSAVDPGEVQIDGEFDLIWCGSLLTHLDAPRWRGFLELFHSLLTADGVLVFTTHGRHVAAMLAKGTRYGLSEAAAERTVASFNRTGFGYGDYPDQDEYGISVSSAAWTFALLGDLPLRVVGYTERGWAEAQDVVATVRAIRAGP
jgi:CBS domain-containing protein